MNSAIQVSTVPRSNQQRHNTNKMHNTNKRHNANKMHRRDAHKGKTCFGIGLGNANLAYNSGLLFPTYVTPPIPDGYELCVHLLTDSPDALLGVDHPDLRELDVVVQEHPEVGDETRGRLGDAHDEVGVKEQRQGDEAVFGDVTGRALHDVGLRRLMSQRRRWTLNAWNIHHLEPKKWHNGCIFDAFENVGTQERAQRGEGACMAHP
jgi:hypothetical protein